jgi:hypothetical protein
MRFIQDRCPASNPYLEIHRWQHQAAEFHEAALQSTARKLPCQGMRENTRGRLEG